MSSNIDCLRCFRKSHYPYQIERLKFDSWLKASLINRHLLLNTKLDSVVAETAQNHHRSPTLTTSNSTPLFIYLVTIILQRIFHETATARNKLKNTLTKKKPGSNEARLMFRTTVVVLVTIKITLVPLQKLEKKFMKHLATHNHAHVHKHTRVYLICVCFFMWLYVRTLRPWLFINPSWVDFYCALFHFYRYYYDFLLFLCEQDDFFSSPTRFIQ